MQTRPTSHLWLVLRIGAALCFIGHGVFGLLRKEAWLPFFAFAGIGPGLARDLMPLVGAVDIAAGTLALVSPRPVVFAYMAVWALFTAALRPLTGDALAEMAERAGNYGVPIALLVMAAPGARLRSWLGRAAAPDPAGIDAGLVERVLVATTVLLLAGHGFIGMSGSALLATHYESVGLAAHLVPTIGAIEISAALALAFRPSVAFALLIVAWKLGTESLFLTAGAPVWEVVERGGSYAAPLALAMVLAQRRAVAGESRPAPGAAAAATGLLLVGLAVASAAPLSAQPAAGDTEMLAMLRRGNVILACRHAITNPDATDRGEDREQQRNLNEDGEAQARRIGRAVTALKLPIAEVLTSPMYRTLESAELSFGRAEVSPLLRMTPDSMATRKLFTEPPPRGRIRVLMTHTGVLRRHFAGSEFGKVPEGGCVVVRPATSGRPDPVALLTEADWEEMARPRTRARLPRATVTPPA